MNHAVPALSLMIGLQCLAAGQVSATESTKPAELGALQRLLVSAGLGAEDDRYHARPEGRGFVLASPAQGLTATFGGDGIEVRGARGAAGMRLSGWGCEATRVQAAAGRAGAEANRVVVVRAGLTEWYVAGPLGVEQGFTVEAPAAGCEAASELVIELALTATATLGDDARSLHFSQADLSYRGLIAVDATGRQLPAGLELTGQRLAIRTDVRSARWPVIVDPTFEDAKLLAADGAEGDRFGISVAISGNTIVVGAGSDDDNGNVSGSAYVFVEPDGGWTGTLTEAAKLLASDGAGGDFLGLSVAISGSTVVLGAVGDDDNGLASGSAYVFVEPGGGWAGTLNEAAKLLASDGTGNDRFGVSVAVSGSTVVVGADSDDDNGGSSGSAYVFVEPVSGWAGTLNEAAKLLPSDGSGADFFGTAVAVSDDTVVVSAPSNDDSGLSSGSAYVFVEPGGGWSGTVGEAAKLLAADGAQGDELGTAVAVSGNTVAVGAPLDADNGDNSGSAYVFTRPGGGWAGTLNEDAKLLAADGAQGDRFGTAVAVSGDLVVVGAPLDDNNGLTSGSAYVFVEPAGGWTGTLREPAWLQPSDGAQGDQFGLAVGVSGETIVIGSPLDNDNGLNSGSAYVGPEIIFADGFESGDTSKWSNRVP